MDTETDNKHMQYVSRMVGSTLCVGTEQKKYATLRYTPKEPKQINLSTK